MVDQPMIVVRGEAFREVPPEIAVFSVDVQAQSRDRAALLSALSERSAQVRDVLAGHDAAIEKRETGSVHVHSQFNPRGSERGTTYFGSVGTSVTVTDFAVLGELLPQLASVQHTSVSGPWWQLRPGSRAGTEVRRAAIADALVRAREYAEAVGARVDRLVEIADEGTGGGQPMMARSLAFKSDESVELQFDPQPQSVQATVIVRVTITEPDLRETTA